MHQTSESHDPSAHGSQPFDVCLINAYPIYRDQRVRKQGDSLKAAGLSVVGLCEGASKQRGLDWPVVEAQPAPALTSASLRQMLWSADLRGLVGVGARFLQPFTKGRPDLAEWLLYLRPLLANLLTAGQSVAARVYVANDWLTLPIAAALAERHCGVFAYDSHEYALEELQESWHWRTFRKPLIAAIEGNHAAKAALVSTVSEEIAAQLQADLGLRAMPLVLRNVPATPPLGYRPGASDGSLTVLYHGGISQPRRLDVLIASVAQWREGARLIVRGDGAPDVLASLKAIAQRHRLGERVVFEHSVPQVKVIEQASMADIGFVCLPPNTRQHLYSMPNKAFEYIHAGIGLVTPPLTSMAKFARMSGAGVVTADFTPEAIAATVNSLTPAIIDDLRKAASRIAPQLTWSAEAAPWVEAIRALVHSLQERK